MNARDAFVAAVIACSIVSPFAAPALALQQSVAAGFDPSLLGAPAPLEGVENLSFNDFDSGDVNGDGLPDLVAYDQSLDSIVLFTNAGGGSFGAPALLDVPVSGLFFPTPRLVDVNGDGHLDVLAFVPQSAATSVLLGDGTGGFTALVVSGGGITQGSRFDVADLDDDGVPDIVLVVGNLLSLSGAIVRLHGNGDGSFEPAAVLAHTRFAGAVVAHDLDADGLMDIAFADSHSGSTFVVVMLGQGGGAFAPGVAWPVSGNSFGSLVVADANGDGHADIYHGSLGDGEIVILPGAGDGTFPGSLVVSVARALDSTLVVADMDRDGVPDLIVSDGQNLLLQRMDRGGPVGAPASVSPLPLINEILVRDLDLDGLPDVVVSEEAGAVLLNALGPFIDIGYGQTSDFGTPVLALSGTPAAGGTVSGSVMVLASSVPGFLIVGHAPGYAPFHGGVLVPTPDVALPVFAGPTFAATWPAGIPAGTAFYAQAVLLPGAGQTLNSNAVVILAE